jgi:hypothetical protein
MNGVYSVRYLQVARLGTVTGGQRPRGLAASALQYEATRAGTLGKLEVSKSKLYLYLT